MVLPALHHPPHGTSGAIFVTGALYFLVGLLICQMASRDLTRHIVVFWLLSVMEPLVVGGSHLIHALTSSRLHMSAEAVAGNFIHEHFWVLPALGGLWLGKFVIDFLFMRRGLRKI